MFTGSIVALVTPMDDKGAVDRASLKKLIDYHVASGTAAIVSVGTTGESATLAHDEHVDVVLQTLEPDAPLASYQKARTSDRQTQDINTPPMPIAWTRLHRNANGSVNRTLTSTIGSATDLADEGVRRLIVNAVFWGLGLPVPAKADVTIVDAYRPSFYGFDAFRKGLRPSDFAMGRAPAADASPVR